MFADEISCSKRLFVTLSPEQKKDFQAVLKKDSGSIVASLCRIDLENATSFLAEDRERIFAVVHRMGGFAGFNNTVMQLIRHWVADSTRASIAGVEDRATESQLADLARAASLLSDQGHLDEAKKMYERALTGREKTLGPDHPNTLSSVNNLAILLKQQGNLDEAKKMYERAFRGYEKVLGADHPKAQNAKRALDSMRNLQAFKT